MGRPRKTEAEKLVQLTVYVAPDLFGTLEKIAASEGDRSVQHLITRILRVTVEARA